MQHESQSFCGMQKQQQREDRRRQDKATKAHDSKAAAPGSPHLTPYRPIAAAADDASLLNGAGVDSDSPGTTAGGLAGESKQVISVH